MAIKTAISLDESLFEQVEALAKEMNMPRSRLFALAVREFIERHENEQLLEAINAAYEEGPDAEEQALQEAVREQHGRMIREEW